MNGLLSELGKKLAERWLSLLVLPGALFLGVLAAGRELGHARWYALGTLPALLDRRAGTVTGSGAELLLFLLAFLLAAAACGLAAQAVGSLAERLWLADHWQAWPAVTHRAVRGLIARRERLFRRRRIETGLAVATTENASRPAETDHEVAVSAARLRRVADATPERPTWTGDRLAGVAARLSTGLGVQVAVVWPHLWLHVPDSTRAEITAARDGMVRAATLAGWSLLYLAAAAVWWPAALVACAVAQTARHRFRTATDAYATLVESAVRLHVQDLGRALGIGRRGPLTAAHGEALTAYLAHGTDPPAHLLLPSDADGPPAQP
ncbi:hypothetical protein ACIF8T_25435 [Streptomyces sp. NPDC085946]|uniref:hypothetical protein n=1 Tax=Streptomyces sp. NPDC085946 TaxID=3365744 RepID=UPI0037CF6E2A